VGLNEMKPITVAMEVTPKGVVIREAFTMVCESNENAEQWQKSLPKQFKNDSYKTAWAKPRVKIADGIKARGNVLMAKSYLF
jgi:hypothetical protein